MATRFLIVVFGLLPAGARAQLVEVPDWWGPPAFVRPVAVGDVATDALGVCQYGIFELTPTVNGLLRVRATWDPADGPFEVDFAETSSYGETGSLLATQVVTAGRKTNFVVGFWRGWWDCDIDGVWSFTVEVSMAPSPPCSYTVSPTSAEVTWDGGQGRVSVGTSNPECEWSAGEDVDWVTLEDTRFRGPAVVTFDVGPNDAIQPRSAALTIAGESVSVAQAGSPDEDGDALPTPWEVRFGLDPSSASGVHGAVGDPDGDGRSNREELLAGTHPRGLFTKYFAEGVTSDFFDLWFAFLNPGSIPARVLVHFRTATGTTEHRALEVPGTAVRTLNPKVVPRMHQAEFSTVIESDEPLVADRTVLWEAHAQVPYGSHTETSVGEPALRWYFAEGSTAAGFHLFYLLQNPNLTEAHVRVRYLRPSAAPLEKAYALPPNSRTTLWVNLEDFPGLGRALASSDVSAAIEVTNGQPIVVERAMYLETQGQVFGAGHESAGVTAPATHWFLAEGATGPFFELFVLIANPGDADAQVEAEYLLPDGTVVKKPYTIASGNRLSICVDLEDPKLADTAVATTIRSLNGVPVVAERAMWWPDGGWYEGHSSSGAATTGTAWALAEGEVGGARGVDTYILLANVSEATGTVKVTLLFEDGTSVDSAFAVTGHSRFNVDVRHEFPVAWNKRFGALIESQGPTPAQLVVERSMYWNATGQFWAAGTNALATKLR